MDGIAICYESFKSGQRQFLIEGIQPAGSEQLTLKDIRKCIEVMTGAVLPVNCNVVIPYEQVTIKDDGAIINLEELILHKNIHPKGKDKKQGDLIINKNTIISAAEIGVLATVGKSKVKVAKVPKVMIISTGDELVGVDETPEVYQIRRSNVFTLVALSKQFQIDAETVHIKDNKETLKNKIETYLKTFDVLLFSGAVSKGKFDFVPEVLNELGVEKLFHKVAQRPGKPFWFGHIVPLNINEQDVDLDEEKVSESSRSGVIERSRNEVEESRRDTVVFAFPGNPISTFVSCLKYFVPWFQKSMGLDFKNRNFAVLSEDVIFKPTMTYFLQVKLENKDGMLLAKPFRGNGSGDLASLVETDAFIELPADKTEFKKGEVFPIINYR